jgi:hypothetical protein
VEDQMTMTKQTLYDQLAKTCSDDAKDMAVADIVQTLADVFAAVILASTSADRDKEAMQVPFPQIWQL